MKIYDYPSPAGENKLSAIIGRGLSLSKKDEQTVSRILEDVRQRGDTALVEYTRRFDAPKMTKTRLKVSVEEMKAAMKTVDRAFLRSLNRAVAQIESFHAKQLEKSWFDTGRPGTLLGQLVNPVDSAGIYVPGGKGGTTPLVSSVLMGVIPANVAGVRHIAIATPPMKTGAVNPYLLAAAKKLGVTDVYRIGSAWAIAALAFGTETIPAVNLIAGPGNTYVTIAKRLVSGTVGIDMVAGPSEILIVADSSANPEYAAADLLSQAEHDVLSSAVLITDSMETAKQVVGAVREQLSRLKRKDIAGKSLSRFGVVLVVSDVSVAIDLANRIAPEHLELLVSEPFAWLGRIRNAGAVFMGHHTPEPVGDYIAGPNHVLPTAGTSRFASALSVSHFLKRTSVIHYSKDALKTEAKDIIRLAEIEGLDAHAHAIKLRVDK